MWKFPRTHSSGDLSLEVQKSQETHGFRNNKEAVQSMFTTTTCYDLMQRSSKVVVFETTIPFQLAFYALVEHDTDIAPLWDPDRKTFVAMMTMTDFIQALRIYRNRGIPVTDLASVSIADMLVLSHAQWHILNINYILIILLFRLASPIAPVRHLEFTAIDPEDTAYELCRLLQRNGTGKAISSLHY